MTFWYARMKKGWLFIELFGKENITSWNVDLYFFFKMISLVTKGILLSTSIVWVLLS